MTWSVRDDVVRNSCVGNLSVMELVRLARAARRWRHNHAALLVMLALSGALVAHHAGPPLGSMHHDLSLGPLMELCMGIVSAVGTALVIATAAAGALRWPRPGVLVPLGVRLPSRVVLPQVRAGPTVLCVQRR